MPSPTKKHKKRRTVDPDETTPSDEPSPDMSHAEKKKKKRKDRKRKAEDGEGDAPKRMRGEKNEIEEREGEEEEAREPSKQDGTTWSDEDLKQLVSNITESLPENDDWSFVRTLKSFEWDSVTFGQYTAEQCQQGWARMLHTVRKQRSLTEIVNDIQDRLKKGTLKINKPKPTRHPDEPKKPSTPFFIFLNKRHKKLKQQHPDMKSTELSKLAAQLYKDLPKEKQKKYQDEFEAQKEQYKADMEQFRADHPGQESTFSLPLPRTAQQIFLDTKIAEQLESDPTADAKNLKDHYRQKWEDLSEKRKVKYTKKAKKEEESYVESYESFCKAHPEQNLAAKPRSSLTKKERLMLDRIEGRPAVPPKTGFRLFSTKMLHQLVDIPSTQRMSVIPGRWKALSEAQKTPYSDEVAKQLEEYREAWKKYLEGLSPERRTQVEEESKRVKKKKMKEPKQERVSAKSITPLSIYMEEKQEFFRMVDSNASDKQLKNMAAKFFKALDPSLKAKYERLAEEKRRSLGLAPWPGEPKKPFGSGYQLFCSEALIEKKLKLNEIAAKWRTLSPKHQQKYISRQKKLVAEYEKELEKFRAGLSADDKQRFDEQHKKKKTPSTSGTAGKSDIEKTEESSSKSESESGSSSESEDENPVQRSPVKKGFALKIASPLKKTVKKNRASSSSSGSSSSSSSDSEAEEDTPPRATSSSKPKQAKSPQKSPATSKLTKAAPQHTKKSATSESSSSSSDSEAEEEIPRATSSSKPKQTKSPQKSPALSQPTKAAPQHTRKSAISASSSSSSDSGSESEPEAKPNNASFQSPPPTQRLMNIAQAAMNYKADSSSSDDDSD